MLPSFDSSKVEVAPSALINVVMHGCIGDVVSIRHSNQVNPCERVTVSSGVLSCNSVH